MPAGSNDRGHSKALISDNTGKCAEECSVKFLPIKIRNHILIGSENDQLYTNTCLCHHVFRDCDVSLMLNKDISLSHKTDTDRSL